MLNQHAVHEILPAGEQDLAVNFIILPEFFRQSLESTEQDGVLFPFLVSTLSGENGERIICILWCGISCRYRILWRR